MRIDALVPLALVSAFAVAAPAAAQETPAPSSPPSTATLHPPHWMQQPSADDIARVYPPQAVRHSLGGQAEVRCFIAPDGRLKDCTVLNESPEGQGFGAAALELAPLFRVAWKDGPPSPVNGSEGTVRIPIRFRIAR